MGMLKRICPVSRSTWSRFRCSNECLRFTLACLFFIRGFMCFGLLLCYFSVFCFGPGFSETGEHKSAASRLYVFIFVQVQNFISAEESCFSLPFHVVFHLTTCYMLQMHLNSCSTGIGRSFTKHSSLLSYFDTLLAYPETTEYQKNVRSNWEILK